MPRMHGFCTLTELAVDQVARDSPIGTRSVSLLSQTDLGRSRGCVKCCKPGIVDGQQVHVACHRGGVSEPGRPFECHCIRKC